MPWLVQAAANDLTTPVGPAIKAMMKAPKGQLIIYKCGHFDVYVEPRFEQTVSDQITFFKKLPGVKWKVGNFMFSSKKICSIRDRVVLNGG
ncbi:MAG: hypothetical protein ACLQDF_08885 [Desulfomonilia bacterium]